jgi:hypothetical protein
MLALHRYRSLVGPCGHYLPDTTAVENEYAYVGVVRRCHACTATAQLANAHKDSPQPTALLFGAERR